MRLRKSFENALFLCGDGVAYQRSDTMYNRTGPLSVRVILYLGSSVANYNFSSKFGGLTHFCCRGMLSKMSTDDIK